MKYLVIFSLLSVFKVNCFDSSEELVHESSDLNSFKSLFTNVNTVYVNKNKYNFKFFTEKNSNVFDCSITGQPEGTIDLNEIGADLTKNTLVIRNCLNVTIECNGDMINSIIISKVSQVTFLENSQMYSYYSNVNLHFDIEATDVDLLILSNFIKQFGSIGLNLKNVQLFDFSNSYLNVRHLKLDNVKIQNKVNSTIFIQNPNSILTVKNSHFGFDLLRFFEGKVRKAEFFNNTFEKIYSEAFKLEANDSFVFSGNHVNILKESFHIICPNVTISHNTIQLVEGILFPKVPMLIGSHQILNFKENVIYKLSSNFLSPSEINFDSLHIANNHLFCSCQLMFSVDKYKNTFIGKLLLELNENFCINFEGCPLSDTIGRISEICANNFDCSKKVKTKNQTSDVENYLQSILLTLQNIKSILSDKNLIKKEIESQTSQLQN